jgi:IS30 family transposase
MTTWFMTAIALSGGIGGPVSGYILKSFNGMNGWHGWQWLFLLEGIPSPGHWEGDLIYGNATSQIATLVERQSRFVMLVKVVSKDSGAVVDALIRRASKLPRELYKSLTWDRGSEMADHNRFTVATDIEVYFCDPQHPWQRGSNENTNGLLRQYFTKGTDFSVYSQARLDTVARPAQRTPPGKTLNFDTPVERFNQIVASTG